MSAPGWPATLRAGAVEVRAPKRGDARGWSELRMSNEAWLKPWEPSAPHSWAERNSVAAWRPMYAALRAAGRRGTMLPFMINFGGRLAGQVNASNVVHGALRSCSIGYWVDREVAGRGVTPTAVALLIDHLFGPVGMHRAQIDIRPENSASLRVVAKLGLREEAYFERYLDIAGGWRDHRGFAVTVEELAGATMLSRLPTIPAPAPKP